MTGRNSTRSIRNQRNAPIRMAMLAAAVSMASVAPAFSLDTLYPAKDGTIVDGHDPAPMDGVPDAWDWYFYDSAPFAGMIALEFGEADRRVFWEYDLSSVSLTPPVAATLTFNLVGPFRFPAPDADVHVYAYEVTLPLSETLSDFDSTPATFQGTVAVPPNGATNQYTVDVSQAVGSALISGANAVAFRFQIDPGAVEDNQQARIDARDNDLDSKPILTIDIAPVELPGDIDNDQDVDMMDVEILVNLLLGPPYSDGYPPEYWDRADMNNDGPVDGRDIQLFVDAMMAAP